MYMQCKNRGKIDQIYNVRERKYDVVILGSSRANNHFVAQMFIDKGLMTFNYGMSGSSLFETSLVLKLMIERKCIIKNVILDADLNLAGDNQSEGISSRFLPYIHNSKITKEHFISTNNFNNLYYIPFYRYIKYENRIGFREMFFNAIHKKTIHISNHGYMALEHVGDQKMTFNMSKISPLPHNKYYEEIRKLCKENNINFIPVMSPMCKYAVGMDYFKKVKKMYPEIYNYENVVAEDKYFATCGHMNDNGAKKFTSIILKNFFHK
ncbi:hypothetical protein GCM10022423_39770 [Flavobacterium ginsengiterrae]|uniref:SGNH/GDSL hydrolase family protein n=2 Tax=Flavobacterium ginsengiterrae TaxID=871695 RepID=A0ABP7H2U9_9FLAO